ncbi:MAG: metal ABC transporter permease [Chloroflexi bacterium]|nr:MAG: metal ABC transporter permease [Chloroflexota bacterium]
MSPQLEIQLVASIVAAACALPGVFLILRRMALMSDAISHSILLGIAVGFLLTGHTGHPLLIALAAASGILTVTLVEALINTRRVKEDAAIGLVFPVLFSIGVILISRYAGDVHLDADAVLLGELAFAPFNRMTVFGLRLPQGVWVMGSILFVNLLFVALFYKELKLATFDAALAAALGFSPALLHYGLMSVVSITAVGAFDHVGSILVVALMIAPPASAYLLTHSLPRMLGLSVLFGVASAIGGYWLARFLDANIAGAMASMTGVFFLLTLLLAPEQGLLARALQRQRRRRRFAVEMLLVHLSRHENKPEAGTENSLAHLVEELKWQPDFAHSTVRSAQDGAFVERQNGLLLLTEEGRQVARQVLAR